MALIREVPLLTGNHPNRNGNLKQKKIVDENDTFYRNIKPFALICKVIGVFSLQNVVQNNGRLLKHTLFSLHTLWGPLLVGMATALNTYFETEHFLSYKGIFYMTRGISVAVLSSYYDKFLPELIYRIEEFNTVMKSNCNNTRKRRNVNTHARLVLHLACVGYIILMCVNVAVLSAVDEYNFPHVGNKICDSFTFLTRQLFVMMYMNFCYNIKLILCSISSIWRQSVKMIVVTGSEDTVPPEDRLEAIRLLHAEAVHTVELLNSAYGLRLLFYLTIYCSEVLLSLYEFANRHVYFKLYFIVYSGLTLYMAAKFTEDITTQGHAMADAVSDVPIALLDRECQQQVEMFLGQIMAKRLQVSAYGLCIINKRLIISIVMGITTFFIAIYQLSEEAQYAEAGGNF